MHADLDNRLDVTVRFQGKYIVIAALICFSVFHQEFVTIALGELFLVDRKLNVAALHGIYSGNLEAVFLYGDDADCCVYALSGNTGQPDIFGLDVDEFFHHAGDGQCDGRILRVSGRNHDIFFQRPSSVTCGADIQAYFSLAAGRDLPRVRGNRAASAGFYPGDAKESGSPIVDGKIMGYGLAGRNSLKSIAVFG